MSPGTSRTTCRTGSWTATDLRRELLNQRHDITFLAGHFSANDALAADYKTNVLSTELETAPANLTNTIVFSAGCHAGYNIVDGHGITGATQKLDWAQAFAKKRSRSSRERATSTATPTSSPTASASTRRSRSSSAERVGSSLLRSKQIFLEESPGLSALDEKALLETTLFGLPMLNVNLAPGGPGGEPAAVSPTTRRRRPRSRPRPPGREPLRGRTSPGARSRRRSTASVPTIPPRGSTAPTAYP